MTDAIGKTEVTAYKIPTPEPESDGTLSWDSHTAVIVQLSSGNQTGLGYSYTSAAAAPLIREKIFPVLTGKDPLAVGEIWENVRNVTRNLGRPGIVSAAMAAVDTAAWDLKARLLRVSLVDLLGPRTTDPASWGTVIYGSGGFTSYSLKQLQAQLGSWAEQGISSVKMKVGRHPQQDMERVEAARQAIGPDVSLMVDANGAYDRKQALEMAAKFAEVGVVWFEEPVSSDDLLGLRLLRDRVPPPIEIAAGEYGYDLIYFQRMLAAGSVDVLMADASRCSGFTEFLRVSALCEGYSLPLSAHTAPNLHAHICSSCPNVRHIEYFADHVRMEELLFDGVLRPRDGRLRPDRSRHGMGLQLKEKYLEQYRVA